MLDFFHEVSFYYESPGTSCCCWMTTSLSAAENAGRISVFIINPRISYPKQTILPRGCFLYLPPWLECGLLNCLSAAGNLLILPAKLLHSPAAPHPYLSYLMLFSARSCSGMYSMYSQPPHLHFNTLATVQQLPATVLQMLVTVLQMLASAWVQPDPGDIFL